MTNASLIGNSAPAQYEEERRRSTNGTPAQIDHACSDFVPTEAGRRNHTNLKADRPIGYRVHSSAWPIQRLPSEQDCDELPMRARKAGAL